MEKIKFVQPTLDYKDQALDFIREFYLYKSPLEGVNGLHRYLNNYEEWLLKIDNDRTNEVSDKEVPSGNGTRLLL